MLHFVALSEMTGHLYTQTKTVLNNMPTHAVWERKRSKRKADDQWGVMWCRINGEELRNTVRLWRKDCWYYLRIYCSKCFGNLVNYAESLSRVCEFSLQNALPIGSETVSLMFRKIFLCPNLFWRMFIVERHTLPVFGVRDLYVVLLDCEKPEGEISQ